MNDLRNIWEIGGLVEDQNHDGVADRVNVWIDAGGIQPDGLIDFCARLGFETTSLSFDFLQKNDRYVNRLSFIKHDRETSAEWKMNQLVISYQEEEALSELLRFLAGKWHRNFVEGDASIQKIKLQQDEMIIEAEDGTYVTSEDLKENAASGRQYSPIHSLTDIWNERGFLHADAASPQNEHAVRFITNPHLSLESWEEIYYGASRIGMESTGLSFPLTGKDAAGGLAFQFQPEPSEGSRIQMDGEVVHFIGEHQSLTHAIAYFFREKHWSFGGHFGSWEKKFSKIETEDEKLFQFTWEDKGEKKILFEYLEEQRENLLKPKASLDMEVFISEPKEIREAIKHDIKKQFPQAEVLVRSGFKPGYFWMMEEILPDILPFKQQIGSIIINCLKEEREDGLELPIRWIQELYPVDEVLAGKLELSSSAIQFALTESQNTAYKVIVKGINGEELYHNEIDIPLSKVTYVEEGKFSYPTTACLRIYENGEQLMQKVFPSDRENFYKFYMDSVLPELWEKVDKTEDGGGFTKPLFDRIEINAEMSEEELKLPVAEERISSLEALHEDLYFNTLDYFLVKGEQTIGKGYTAPGGIYPFIRVQNGSKPKAEITAYKWVDRKREVVYTEAICFNKHQLLPVSVNYRVGEQRELISEKISHSDVREIEELPEDLPYPKKASVRPWLADFSYRGEPIFVYDFIEDTRETYYSAIKLAALKPTILIETGHHANEVSSMSAQAELIDEIAQKHPGITKNMNLVIIPRANPDGVVLHQRMTRDNPEWKHHAARYNAVGLEYTVVRYERSVFGEANVVPKIMNRWAPDVVIDNHGVPSHEWTQPFAGYHIPPRFHMSYWIPNALIYGIARKLDEQIYPEHAAILDKMINGIKQKINQSEIRHMNAYWMERYKKYGNQFMPKLFPIELKDDFNFYEWLTNADISSTSAISRFPEWVSADLISEAADETVYDDVLSMCKEGQRLFNLGAVDWIKREDQEVERYYLDGVVGIKRVRPLGVGEAGKGRHM